MSEPKFIVLDKTETVFESWAKDVVTFGFLLLCIYVSRDSTWWTFATGCLALIFIAGKVQLASKRTKKCNSKDELRVWVDSLE